MGADRGGAAGDRVRVPTLAVYALAGSALHAAVLLLPPIALGSARRVLGDAVVWAFLLLASGFYLGDLPTLGHDRLALVRQSLADDRLARRRASFTGTLLLATFWIALLERALRGHGTVGGWQAVGGALMLVGVAVRAAAVRTLGRLFVTEVVVDADRPLVERGIYAWLRHPSEAGNLAIALGAGLLLESRLALIVTLAGLLPVILRRIGQEDRCLADAFGGRFRRYAARVQRLIPGIY